MNIDIVFHTELSGHDDGVVKSVVIDGAHTDAFKWGGGISISGGRVSIQAYYSSLPAGMAEDLLRFSSEDNPASVSVNGGERFLATIDVDILGRKPLKFAKGPEDA